MAEAIGLRFLNGQEISIALNEPLYLTASSRKVHNACTQYAFHQLGKYLVFTYSSGGGNPYPAQQVSYATGEFREFRAFQELHPLLRDGGYLEFEKNDCVVSLLGHDGIVNRLCLREGTFHITAIRLEGTFQEDSFHSFLCDFSKESPEILEYQFKSLHGPDTLEYEPSENMEKMRTACVKYQAAVKQPNPL